MKKKHNVALFTSLKVMPVKDLSVFLSRPQELRLAPGHWSALGVGSHGWICQETLTALWAWQGGINNPSEKLLCSLFFSFHLPF